MNYLNGVDPTVTSLIDKETDFTNNKRPSQQNLQWFAYWKITGEMLAVQGFVNAVSISPFGDVVVVGGNEFFSVWSRDSNLVSHSYSLHLLYGKELPKNVFAQNKREIDIGQIVQVEFADDGRSFVTLEQDNETMVRKVRIWYNKQVD